MPRTRTRNKQDNRVTTNETIHEKVSGESTRVVPVDAVVPNQSSTINQSNKGVIRMPLSMDQINALKATTRTKGLYLGHLNTFVGTGEGGVCVQEEWPADFPTDKKAATVKQGFENAKNSKNAAEGSSNVQVILNEEKVFLINNGAGATAASDDE